MKDIAIYGFGGFGREIACLIRKINESKPTWNLIGYFDDGVNVGVKNSYGEVLGGLRELNTYSTSLSIVFAIAAPLVVNKLYREIVNSNIEYPNLIAPNVFFFDESTITMGKGNIITFGNRFSCNIKLGDFNLINGCCSFGHDVVIGSFNVLQPEVRVSGSVTIGDTNFLGARSFLLQQIKIGNNTKIGAMSLVVRKTKDNESYFGTPAKRIK